MLYAHICTHSKLELDGVNWDFEAIIRIKRLEINCDERRGGADDMGGREGEGGRGETREKKLDERERERKLNPSENKYTKKSTKLELKLGGAICK